MNPSTYDIILASAMSLMSAVSFVLAFRIYTRRKNRWRGQHIYPGRMRKLLTGLLTTLGCLMALGAVGDLLYSNIINGFVELGAAMLCLVSIVKLHRLIPPVTVFMPPGRFSQQIDYCMLVAFAILFAAGAVTNFVFGIHI